MADPRFDKEPEAWMDFANCTGVDPELFFPRRGEPDIGAREVCERCDVRRECALAALAANEIYGVWGGLSRKQRLRIQRGRTTLDAEMTKRAKRCVECGDAFHPELYGANRKTCSDMCATRRQSRLARERLAAKREAS